VVEAAKKLILQVTRIAAGGDGIANAADGKVVFVPGTMPGDTVEVALVNQKKRFANARLLEVIEPAPGRRAAPCPHIPDGCGGCDWQHVSPGTQKDLRVAIVSDALRRIGRLDAELVSRVVHAGPPLIPVGYRTTVRAIVQNGRAGYRRASSHDAVVVNSCMVAHPLVEEILVAGRFPGATEVTVRVGANTGERLVIVEPSARGANVPDGVAVIGTDDLEAGRQAYFHEEVAGHRFRISAQSFFQCRPDGAQVLTELAAEAIKDVDGDLLDAYGGVGLFGSICSRGRPVTGVELNPFAVADARVNLPPGSQVVESAFCDWEPQPFAAVIADPARSGLGETDAIVLTQTEAQTIVLVSCDPASLGRDAGLLTTMGYELERTDVVDLFGQTSHTECVSKFVRTDLEATAVLVA
jgi:23S rRNA (uracil1939-C5)-methyltransferase